MKNVMIIFLLFVVVGSSGVFFDGNSYGAAANDQGSAATAVNAGNKFCPMMGGAVTQDSPNKVEYKGKLYNLCCSGCKEGFLRDPEAALKKLADMEAAVK